MMAEFGGKLPERRCLELSYLKLQALVYDILPSTTAVFSYVIVPINYQLTSSVFLGAQTVVSLLKTTRIRQGVSFIAANKVYTSTNKSHNRLNRDGTLFLLFLPGVDASHVYVRAWALRLLPQSYQ